MKNFDATPWESIRLMATLFSVQVGAVLTIVEWGKRQDQRGR